MAAAAWLNEDDTGVAPLLGGGGGGGGNYDQVPSFSEMSSVVLPAPLESSSTTPIGLPPPPVNMAQRQPPPAPPALDVSRPPAAMSAFARGYAGASRARAHDVRCCLKRVLSDRRLLRHRHEPCQPYQRCQHCHQLHDLRNVNAVLSVCRRDLTRFFINCKYFRSILDTVNGEEDNDLSFKKGDVIELLDTSLSWWKGRVNGEEGYFPSNYVEEF
jgi:hypothetical protein